DAMVVMAEETFGPVAPVRVVGSFEEGLEAANRSRYGLAATVLTRDLAHAQTAWRTLRTGTVKVNAVFGGAPGGAATPRGARRRGRPGRRGTTVRRNRPRSGSPCARRSGRSAPAARRAA